MDDGASAVSSPSKIRAALAGLAAAGAALAVGELAAAIRAPLPGPVYAVANRVVDKAPTWFVQFGKRVFGLSDKPALLLGTTLAALVLGAAMGLASRRSPRPGVLGIVAFGLVGALAIGTDSRGSWLGAIVVSALAVAAGVVTLRALRNRAIGAAPVRPARGLTPVLSPTAGTPVDPAVTRRSFLSLLGVMGVGAAAAGAGAKVLRSRSTVTEARDAVQITAPLSAADLQAQVAAASTSPVGATAGITSLVIPNNKFYKIDTTLLTPQVNPATWKLRIKGMVDNEKIYTYDELLARASTVAPVTLSCVSNEVGGNLVGNAVWQGVPLRDLLAEAGVKPGATQIASRSVDGWTCGFPTAALDGDRTALVALAMNDEPLPLDHGFPARLVVAGLYGYVSATKWLSEIEATTLEAVDGYWIPRGWAKLGPVKTESRIDTPRSGARLTAGSPVPIAGVAWAPSVGVAKVEVQVDQGQWMRAQLGESLGVDAWRQWLAPWSATTGRHTIRVRATDNSGYTQTEEEAPPAPDGASGWHRIDVNVA